ncbi:hypothetical protein [Mycoplasma sp. P36-A1]|uniref:hypothetical protein n=1 Tax=Mycoplasma sp. P36-A1 TaxID=3252900 RepID=UPI003C2D1054
MKLQYFIRSKKGSASIIVIALVNIILFQTMHVRLIFLENKYYLNNGMKNYNTFALENLLVQMIYSDHTAIILKRKDLNITSDVNKISDGYEINIKVYIKKEIINYYALYDYDCDSLLQFYKTSTELQS